MGTGGLFLPFFRFLTPAAFDRGRALPVRFPARGAGVPACLQTRSIVSTSLSRHSLTPIALVIAGLPSAWAEEPATDAPELAPVTVTAPSARSLTRGSATLQGAALEARKPTTSDTAALLADVPGVALQSAGGVSSLPVVHGLADDRLRITVDGVDAIASCPNHMNPPLSYLAPSVVQSARVYAGLTPVSVGGDSIGGSIVVETKPPVFAEAGKTLATGEIGGFYRSNGHVRGADVSATLATDALSLSYRGSVAQGGDYRAGGDFKTFTATGNPGQTLDRDVVGSTAYKTQNHALGVAWRSGGNLVEATYSRQNLPYQLYPNQRMDMLDNQQTRVNLRYTGEFDWGTLQAQVYHEEVDHYMNFGEDKQFWYGTAPGMPMYTRSHTTGARLGATVDLGERGTLRAGTEYQRYTLADWWPVSGTGMMAPYTFWNLRDGLRERVALYGEWEKRHSPQWLTQLGLRLERVTSDAAPVHGYNQDTAPTATAGTTMANQISDAATLNTAERRRTDYTVDLTAMARYTLDAGRDIQFGYAHKERAPNLYERYSWSTWPMAAVMNNTVGDGNGYFGNPALKPEKADTLSATFDLHAPDRSWELQVTPYYTHVRDYIDAVQWSGNAATGSASTVLRTDQFVVLRYANQTARLYGLDLSGRAALGHTAWGDWELQGALGYTRGRNLDTGHDLYNVMPLHAKLTLAHQLGGWNNRIEWEGVAAKDHVSTPRNEIRTPGYGLLHLRSSYEWKNLRLDVGVENALNKLYYLPLGGAYAGQGKTMGINAIPWGIAVPGPGRSFYVGVKMKF